MRSGWACVLAAVVASGVAGAQDEDRPTPQEAEQIPALIRQLGAEDFHDREAASKALDACAWKAVKELEAAAQSDDPEVRRRAGLLLRTARAHGDESRWLEAVRTSWPDALKAGRIGEPFFGQLETPAKLEEKERQPQQDVNASTVDTGLEWLAARQAADGSWTGRAAGGQSAAELENTAVSLLAFLGAGHSTKVGFYKARVLDAVCFLMRCQRADGAILNPGWKNVDAMAHTWAGMALAEASGMSRDPEIARAAQKAIDYSLKELRAAHGGFGRLPRAETADLVSTALVVMHYKTCKIAGLSLSAHNQEIDSLLENLNTFEDKEAKAFRLVQGGATSAEATFLGVLAQSWLGVKPEKLSPYLTAAWKTYRSVVAEPEGPEPFIRWVGMLDMFQQGGDLWKEWHNSNRTCLAEGSIDEGEDKGAWKLSGPRRGAGKVLSNAFNALSLEIYYRVPILLSNP
ncbi:MAG: terpene cyclase/mutase family protein [Planctomycetota bacterium]|nr:terpene cyclase/mutase family protein [Planctomycetota bacterium]